ncbi:hypothetical protein WA026_005306 [Henosepilachna vigintioctopunctata]
METLGYNSSVENMPKEYICSAKCINDKYGLIENNTLQIDRLRRLQSLLVEINDQEGFLKCVEKIGTLKSCEEFIKFFKCERRYIFKGRAKCRKGGNNIELKFKDLKTRNLCISKCILVKKGVLMDNGEIDVEAMVLKTSLLWYADHSDELFDCLKNLRIKDCEDIKKISLCFTVKKYKDMKFFSECSEKYDLNTEKRSGVYKILQGEIKPKLEYITKRELCATKCFHEKQGMIKNGKFVIDKVMKDIKILSKMKDINAYLNCLTKITFSNSCEDYEKAEKCKYEYYGFYIENCLNDFNLDLETYKKMFSEVWKKPPRKEIIDKLNCIETCILKKKNLIHGNGKLKVYRMKNETTLFWNEKNPEDLSKCLALVDIKKCQDYKNVLACVDYTPLPVKYHFFYY